MADEIVCFYCGKKLEEGPRRVEWKGYPAGTSMHFHPKCLVGQIQRMRGAVQQLHKEGWV